jgi:Transposase, Mutator family
MVGSAPSYRLPTKAIETLNAKLRRSVRSRGHFPSDEAAMKLIWLQLREITQEWKMPAREWSAAKAQFAGASGTRDPQHICSKIRKHHGGKWTRTYAFDFNYLDSRKRALVAHSGPSELDVKRTMHEWTCILLVVNSEKTRSCNECAARATSS